VDAYLDEVRDLVLRLDDEGLFDELGRVIVTVGGSAYFDQVAAALTKPWPDHLPVLPVLRSGAYISHDDGFYRGISPLSRTERPFHSALRAWAQVTSKPQEDLALLTIGKRDASFDEGLPEPQVVRGRDGVERPLTGAKITALNDQHAFLSIGVDSPEVGDWVGLGLSHPCTVFDKWQLIPVVDGTTVIDLVRTFF
jgi:D-serine deaminase-like pyridoxal phosphate-dependent protein